MKEGACLRGEARCGIPFPGVMWLPRVPGTYRMHLVFQGPSQRHRGTFGALVCTLWDVGPGTDEVSDELSSKRSSVENHGSMALWPPFLHTA